MAGTVVPVVPLEAKLTVPVAGVKVPVFVKTVPFPVRLMVEPVPPLSVALAATVSRVATVTVGLVPPMVVVIAVEPSPMVRLPNVMVPAVPAQEDPLAPTQLVPEALERTVVVALED